MKRLPTKLPGLLLLEPAVFGDDRGFFLESYNQRTFAELGIRETFVQDNHSFSGQNVIRGLHYQIQQPQGKLVRAVTGQILDVAVDLRRSSPTFGQWESFPLSGENKRMLWIPAGFAHGFRVTAPNTHVLYKATGFYAPEHERTIFWNDPDLHIDWQFDAEPEVSTQNVSAPIVSGPVVSGKDQRGVTFQQAEKFA
jgi:dTDP-4-dehydrorhamnose 3,5-epimerase